MPPSSFDEQLNREAVRVIGGTWPKPEEVVREYLAWEIALVAAMANDHEHRFRVIAG